MKIIILYFFVLMFFSACQDDAIDFSEKSQEIRFSLDSSGVQTRAWGTSFDIGDKVGIYVVRHKSDVTEPILKASGNFADNKCYKVVTGGILQADTESDKIYSSEKGYIYSIFAYYPYDSTITDPTNIDFEVDTYQKELSYVKKSDFMSALTFYANINDPVTLIFQRKLSYLNVVYNKNPEGIIPDHIAVYGLYSKCKINLQTGIVQEGNNHVYGTISPMYQVAETADQYCYSMIVPPFNFKNNVHIQVSVNENLSHYYIQNSLPLQGGTTNTIYLSEAKKNVTCSITTDEGVGGTVSGEGVYIKGRQCTVSAKEYYSYIFDGWYKNGILISKSLDYTFVVTDDVNLDARFSKSRIVTIHDNRNGYFNEQLKGAGSYRKNETCYLKADNRGRLDNYTFIGWFVNGKLMSRHWWYAFQPQHNMDIEARYEIVWYGGWWETEEVTFPATGTHYWEKNCNTVTTYNLDAEPAVHSIEAFFVEDSSYYEYPHFSMYGTFEDLTVEVKSLDLKRTLAAIYGPKGEVRYQNVSEPGMHIIRKIRYKYVSQRNRPVKGVMYYRSISYHAHQFDFEPYYP